MSDYYEWKFDTLVEAMEFLDTYRSMGRSVIFRGQNNAQWQLKSALFRRKPSQEEIDRRFRKTESFLEWCRQNRRLPHYSDNEVLQVAQHYGMPTDLLDFLHEPRNSSIFCLRLANLTSASFGA